MSAEEVNKKTSVSLGCSSWAGTLVTIAIIVLRALQPNAQPIETWSFSSWCWMMLPMVFPLLFWAVFFILWAITYIAVNAFSKN